MGAGRAPDRPCAPRSPVTSRTASGYRKFSAADVERLRYVLTAQRDQYLPLRVIREHLATMVDTPGPVGLVGAVTPAGGVADVTDLRLGRDELPARTGLTEPVLAALEQHGLVAPRSVTLAEPVDAMKRAARSEAQRLYGAYSSVVVV